MCKYLPADVQIIVTENHSSTNYQGDTRFLKIWERYFPCENCVDDNSVIIFKCSAEFLSRVFISKLKH